MSSKNHLTPAAAHRTDPCATLQRVLDEVRAAVVSADAGKELDRALWTMSDAAERIVSEHRGMADELISVYEQLGVIFEVVRKLSTVQTESEVLEVFVESLCSSFSGREVSVFPASDQGSPGGLADLPTYRDWIQAAVDNAWNRRTVVVEEAPRSAADDSIAEVMVGPVFAGEVPVCAIVLSRSMAVPAFRSGEMLILESLTTFCGDLIRVQRLAHELHGMSTTLVRSLVNAVDQKDEYTSGHSLRVGYFATLIGQRLGLSSRELQILQWSALLHDTGKLGIRDEVLKKKGKLTREEFAHIQEHPMRSYKVVQQVPQLAQSLDGVLHHHEHYDGSGYPDGLAGEGIPLQARIIQVADVFDALTSTRSYRAAYTWEQALEILEKEAGKTVDPRLERIFSELMHEKLDGEPDSWVRLVRQAESCVDVLETVPQEGEG